VKDRLDRLPAIESEQFWMAPAHPDDAAWINQSLRDQVETTMKQALDHVELAYQARLLERDINANTYRKAIARLGDILENPLMNRPS